ncbi:MAG: hypothetical protein WCO45_09545 [Pseudanabaena sp. ELA607]|jgi:hypothetical protein
MTNLSANLSANFPDIGTVFVIGIISLLSDSLYSEQIRHIDDHNTQLINNQNKPNYGLYYLIKNILIYLLGWGLGILFYGIAINLVEPPSGKIPTIILAMGAWLFITLMGQKNQEIIPDQLSKNNAADPSSHQQFDLVNITAAKLKQCLPSSLIQLQQVVITAEMVYGHGILRLTNLDRAYNLLQGIFAENFPQQPWFLEAVANNSETEDGTPILLSFPRISDQSGGSSNPKISFNLLLTKLLPYFLIGLILVSTYEAYHSWLYCGGIVSIMAAKELTTLYLYQRHKLQQNHQKTATSPVSLWLPCFGGAGWLGSCHRLPLVQSRSVLWQLAVLPNLVSSGLALMLFLFSGIGDLSHPISQTNPDLNIGLSLSQAFNLQQWSNPPSWGLYFCHQLKIQLQNYLFPSITLNLGSNWVGHSGLTLAAATGLLINALQLIPLSHTEGRYVLQTIWGTARTRQWLPSIKLLFLGFAVIAQPWLQLPLIATFTMSYPLLPTTEDLRDISTAQEIITLIIWLGALIFLLPIPRSLSGS